VRIILSAEGRKREDRENFPTLSNRKKIASGVEALRRNSNLVPKPRTVEDVPSLTETSGNSSVRHKEEKGAGDPTGDLHRRRGEPGTK